MGTKAEQANPIKAILKKPHTLWLCELIRPILDMQQLLSAGISVLAPGHQRLYIQAARQADRHKRE
jgi:hypothetical protein